MSKSFFTIAFTAIIICSGFMVAQEFKNSHAEVDQVQGVYVFYRCKPVRQYDYLGTVSSPAIIKNYKGSYLVDLMVKRAKEKYSSCDAVIFKNEDMTEVDAVKLK